MLFAINRMSFRLMHDAVGRVAKGMVNPLMILPGKFVPLPPLACGLPAAENGGIVWTNKSLNVEQRLAVREVVRGVHAPLPYLIFFPPGTGKTSTLVEAAVQVRSVLSLLACIMFFIICNSTQCNRPEAMMCAFSSVFNDLLRGMHNQ